MKLSSLEYLANPLRTDSPFGKYSQIISDHDKTAKEILFINFEREMSWSFSKTLFTKWISLKFNFSTFSKHSPVSNTEWLKAVYCKDFVQLLYISNVLLCRTMGSKRNGTFFCMYLSIWQTIRTLPKLRKYSRSNFVFILLKDLYSLSFCKKFVLLFLKQDNLKILLCFFLFLIFV